MRISSMIFLRFALVLLLFATTTYINFRLSEKVKENEHFLAGSTSIVRNSNKLQRNILNMVNGLRGFLLTGENYFVQAYDSAAHENESIEEAVSHLACCPESSGLPDLVLVDINTPRMNGLEFLSLVRATKEWKHLRCFILTGSDENIDRETALKLQVSGYIVKPFKMQQFGSIDSFNLMIDLINMKGN